MFNVDELVKKLKDAILGEVKDEIRQFRVEVNTRFDKLEADVNNLSKE